MAAYGHRPCSPQDAARAIAGADATRAAELVGAGRVDIESIIYRGADIVPVDRVAHVSGLNAIQEFHHFVGNGIRSFASMALRSRSESSIWSKILLPQ
jgi:hypothetical protein